MGWPVFGLPNLTFACLYGLETQDRADGGGLCIEGAVQLLLSDFANDFSAFYLETDTTVSGSDGANKNQEGAGTARPLPASPGTHFGPELTLPFPPL